MEEIRLALRECGTRDAESSHTDFSDGETHDLTIQGNSPRKQTPRKRKRSMSPISKANLAEARAEAKRQRGGALTPKAEKTAQMKRYLAVGIDFGHTFLGVAFLAAGRQQANVAVMTDWRDGERMEKAPTRIAYASENLGLDHDVCGYEVHPGMISHQLFKLKLDHSPINRQFDDPLLQNEEIEGRTFSGSAFEKTRDTLRYVYQFVLETLQTKLTKVILRETPIRFYLTTPAMWSLEARSETRRAAEDAGFVERETTLGIEDELYIIDEPESAIIAALKTATDMLPRNNSFKAKQVLIIADLGGGTTDLGSYEVVKLNPLELAEICVGMGAKIGGTSLDRALYQMMEERFGAAFISLDKIKTSAGSDFMREFEDTKRNFNPEKTTRMYRLPLKMKGLNPRSRRMAEFYDFEDCKVKLSFSDMETLFTRVIKNSWGLVEQQMDLIRKKKKCLADGIVLAGGLGSSRYVSHKFRELAKKRWGPEVQILQPLNPWSAICRGAALQGHQGDQILARHCRASYGFAATVNFVHNKHLFQDLIVDALGKSKAKDQMVWPFQKGEKLKVGALKLRGCTYVVPAGITEFTATEALYQYDGEHPPTRLEPDVYKVGTISIDLTGHLRYKRSQAKKHRHSANRAIKLEVDLAFCISGDKGVIEVSALVGKKPVGKAKMEWEPESNWTAEVEGEDADFSRAGTVAVKEEPGLFYEGDEESMEE